MRLRHLPADSAVRTMTGPVWWSTEMALLDDIRRATTAVANHAGAGGADPGPHPVSPAAAAVAAQRRVQAAENDAARERARQRAEARRGGRT